MSKHFGHRVSPSLSDKHGQILLSDLLAKWSNHNVMVAWLANIFRYLDRYFVKQRLLPPLKEVGLTSFREVMNRRVRGLVISAVLTLIGQDREGVEIDWILLRNVLAIFRELECSSWSKMENSSISMDIEEHIIENAACFYSCKAQAWLSEYSYAEYLLKVDEFVSKEEERVRKYLHICISHKQKLMEKLWAAFTPPLFENDLHSGFYASLRNDKVEELSTTYRIARLMDSGLNPLVDIFVHHFTGEAERFMKLLEASPSNTKYKHIERLLIKENEKFDVQQDLISNTLELQGKFKAYITECFQGDKIFSETYNDLFKTLIEKVSCGFPLPLMLAQFCHEILKEGASRKLSDEAFADACDNIIRLLSWIKDKDLFAEFYTKLLSRRLLANKFVDERERDFLFKWKEDCGYELTAKTERMIESFNIGRDHQNDFEKFLAKNPTLDPGFKFAVTVLPVGIWQDQVCSDINLPAEMANCVKAFEQFNKTAEKKLYWMHFYGTCTINAMFEAKTIELTMSTCQAAVLLQFEDSDRLSFSEITTRLNMSDRVAATVLHSLSCGSYKILNKEPTSSDVMFDDVFELNLKFTHTSRKLRIPECHIDMENDSKEVEVNAAKVVKEINKDRSHQISACLVRIMKSRKVMHHELLVSECVGQLCSMFTPEIKDIKKQIESLITSEYLGRGKEDPSLYTYKA
ncbi:hypothetical protein ACP70R_004891 [Stipagrostis hirtigluma subsp. patula]